MIRLLRYPAINGIFISLFSAFYSLIFFITAGHIEFQRILYYTSSTLKPKPFWSNWAAFLHAGNQKYIGAAIIILTLLIIVFLIKQHRPYDEYQVKILANCFMTAGFITICAVALLFFYILSEHVGTVEKMTLFIIVHWISVLIADLVFVLYCHKKKKISLRYT